MGLTELIKKRLIGGQKRDYGTMNYPSPDDLFELEERMHLKEIGAIHSGSCWVRTQVGEVFLQSGRTAVYSVIMVHDSSTPRTRPTPRTESIQIEGYKTGFFGRKVRKFADNEGEAVTEEVRRKLESRYDMARFERVHCM